MTSKHVKLIGIDLRTLYIVMDLPRGDPSIFQTRQTPIHKISLRCKEQRMHI